MIKTDIYTKLFIKSISDINEQDIFQMLGYDYEYRRSSDYIVLYKMEINEVASLTSRNVSELITKCTSHLYCNNCPVPLPPWFLKGKLPAPSVVLYSLQTISEKITCTLSSSMQFENYPSYLKNKKEKFSSSLAAELDSKISETSTTFK